MAYPSFKRTHLWPVRLCEPLETMKKTIRSLGRVLCITTCLAICSCEKHPWEALVHPKTGQMPFDLALGHYATLEECRTAALSVLSKTHPEEGATPDYECGFKCSVSSNPAPPGMLASRICEETSK